MTGQAHALDVTGKDRRAGQTREAGYAPPQAGRPFLGQMDAAGRKQGHHLAGGQGVQGGAKGAVVAAGSIHRNALAEPEQPVETEALVFLAGDDEMHRPPAGGEDQQRIQTGNVIGHHQGRAGRRQGHRIDAAVMPGAQEHAVEAIDDVGPVMAPVAARLAVRLPADANQRPEKGRQQQKTGEPDENGHRLRVHPA